MVFLLLILMFAFGFGLLLAAASPVLFVIILLLLLFALFRETEVSFTLLPALALSLLASKMDQHQILDGDCRNLPIFAYLLRDDHIASFPLPIPVQPVLD
jgi:hypothetical protein